MSDHDLDNLMLLLDGALPPDEEVLLRARLEDEPALAKQWHGLQAMQGALRHEMGVQISADFTAKVMHAVRQTEQIPPSVFDRIITFLSRPIAVPVAAAAAIAIMWAVGLPQASTLPPLDAAASQSANSANQVAPIAAGETEIESIDNQTDFNVLVLAAPGSPNRMIWLTQRNSDEG
jgi:anti-sigma factor RsiW